MGHFYHTVEGIGKDRDAAVANAYDRFYYEYGHDHHIYDQDTQAEFVEKVPPNKWITEQVQVNRHHHYELTRSIPNTDAPADQWLEKWMVTIHSHA